MLTCLVACDADSLPEYRGHLNTNDVIVISAGGRSVRVVRETVIEARKLYPGLRVYLSCGPKRVGEMSTIPQVDCVMIDWEASSVEAMGEVWTWDWTATLGKIGAISTPVRGRYGLLITAAPLANRALIRQGVAWRYDMFTEMAACAVVLQTQGLIRRGTFPSALIALVAQHGGKKDKLARLGFEVSFGEEAANKISPSLAVKATRVALETGISQVYLFGMNVPANLRYLRLVEGLR
mgnify:CR=1 FL=1